MTDSPNEKQLGMFAEVVFLSAQEGGRSKLPEAIRGYMPHAVADGCEDYLGVRFVDGPDPEVGKVLIYRLEFMYHPRVDYSRLVVGNTFTLREGREVVARGRVIELLR